MSRFNFGNRRNDGSSERERQEREVYFNRPSGRPEEGHYPNEYDQSDARMNRGNERADDYRQYPEDQQNHPYFKGQPENGPRNQIGTRQDFQHLRAYGKSSHPDELKGLSFWKDEEDDLHDDPESWSDRSSPLKFVVAISGIFIFSAIAWFAYRWVSQTGGNTPPLIQAEQGPYKVRPENPGGIAIPHQDKLIYGRLSGESDQPVERLLPPPEQPVVMNPTSAYPYPGQQGQPYPDHAQPQDGGYQQQYEQAAPGYQGQPQVPMGYQQYPQGQGPTYQQYPPQHAGQPGGQQNYIEPYPQQAGHPYPNQGYPQQPQGANYPQQAQPQGPMQPGMQQPYPNYGNIPAPVAAPVNRNPGPPAHRPSEAQRGMGQIPILKESMDHKPVLKEEASSLPAQGAAFFVQLATLPTEQLAKQEASRLSKKFKHDLSGNEMTVRMVEKADGTKSFRVIAGPFKTRNVALAKSTKFGSGSRIMQLQND
ncbi:MAG: SPOR domain-containing protein [Alphaproteobacteria bacterium]|nr:SPOR domain-containing protein [Alphaproteobacteria bacterium]